jgi:hypothetical protein
MRHHVAERFDVDVIGLHGAGDGLLRGEEISGQREPFGARELIDARDVPRIENQLALPTIGLVLRQIQRRHRERRHQVPVLVGGRSRRIQRTAGAGDERCPLRFVGHRCSMLLIAEAEASALRVTG